MEPRKTPTRWEASEWGTLIFFLKYYFYVYPKKRLLYLMFAPVVPLLPTYLGGPDLGVVQHPALGRGHPGQLVDDLVDASPPPPLDDGGADRGEGVTIGVRLRGVAGGRHRDGRRRRGGEAARGGHGGEGGERQWGFSWSILGAAHHQLSTHSHN